ncbi:hypothetical protein [Duganella sp. Leaf126]|uniref:hypothetical protein n=1 Tax=Duganella sp. Leaf126 TaxID=1736266 RepID=UPI000AEAD249|nr:hypothetical protein [Duganella sp. Leaf126]
MSNSFASRSAASPPGNRQLAAGAPDQAVDDARACLFHAIADLEHVVAAWLTTPAALDQRTHPSIRQFLVDIREYATALERGGKVSPNIIVAAADRLAGKVHHPSVDQGVGAVRAALGDYVRLLHG